MKIILQIITNVNNFEKFSKKVLTFVIAMI
nr:MAG TPA: hypothetical protein [Caudoviricetes sp.]